MFASRRSFGAADQPVEADPVLLREAQRIIVLEPPSHLCDFRCGYAVVGRDQIEASPHLSLKYARSLRRSAFIIAPLGRAGLPVTVHELLASFVEAVECSPQFLLEPARPIAIPAPLLALC